MNIFTHDLFFLTIVNDYSYRTTLNKRTHNASSFEYGVVSVVEDIRREFRVRKLTPDETKALTDALWERFVYNTNPEAQPTRNEAQPTPNEKEEQTMSATKAPAFETKHFVNGFDATTLTDEDLIQAIKNLEAEITKLGDIKTESAKIKDKINQLNAQRAAIAQLLDSRP